MRFGGNWFWKYLHFPWSLGSRGDLVKFPFPLFLSPTNNDHLVEQCVVGQARGRVEKDALDRAKLGVPIVITILQKLSNVGMTTMVIVEMKDKLTTLLNPHVLPSSEDIFVETFWWLQVATDATSITHRCYFHLSRLHHWAAEGEW